MELSALYDAVREAGMVVDTLGNGWLGVYMSDHITDLRVFAWTLGEGAYGISVGTAFDVSVIVLTVPTVAAAVEAMHRLRQLQDLAA